MSSGNVVAPFAQRRQRDLDHVDAEVEVLAERAGGHGALEIAVGGGDDADVDVHLGQPAQPRELAVLQHLQQLGLQRRAHLADLVEEDRAVVRRLELAGLGVDRAGERAPLEAEQLRFEEVRRQRGTVDLHEGLVAPHRVPAQAARHQLLAGAGLAAHQDGDVRIGDPLDQRPHDGHLLARAEEQRVDGRRPAVAGAAAAGRCFSAAARAASSSRPSNGRAIKVADGALCSRIGNSCRSAITTIGTCRSISRNVARTSRAVRPGTLRMTAPGRPFSKRGTASSGLTASARYPGRRENR